VFNDKVRELMQRHKDNVVDDKSDPVGFPRVVIGNRARQDGRQQNGNCDVMWQQASHPDLHYCEFYRH
ncbi:MAG: hypothetical protein O6945_01515, partial [Gammaproteobacteria bacterium]|nr:hypothetical protein [Gammaproteobacteria bacterium]